MNGREKESRQRTMLLFSLLMDKEWQRKGKSTEKEECFRRGGKQEICFVEQPEKLMCHICGARREAWVSYFKENLAVAKEFQCRSPL